MKKLSFILLFSSLFTAAGAQTFSFGAKGGLNLAKVTNAERSKTRTSFNLGAFARVGLTEQWSIQPELVYSGQGFVRDLPLIGDYTVAVNYLNVPVMAQYHLVPMFYLEAGPQIGFRVAAKGKEDGNTLDLADSYRGVDFGLGFGAGLEFDFGLGINARYNFGLSDIHQDEDFSYKNSVAQFGISYIFGKLKH